MLEGFFSVNVRTFFLRVSTVLKFCVVPVYASAYISNKILYVNCWLWAYKVITKDMTQKLLENCYIDESY